MIRKQPFGRTGHMSTVTLFGGVALGNVTQEETDRTLDLLLEYGVNHIDTAASYGDAELRIGPWMVNHRDKFFLATKTGERTYDAVKEELHRSLERLQTDQLDLIQLHNLVHPDEWDVAFGPGGAVAKNWSRSTRGWKSGSDRPASPPPPAPSAESRRFPTTEPPADRSPLDARADRCHR